MQIESVEQSIALSCIQLQQAYPSIKAFFNQWQILPDHRPFRLVLAGLSRCHFEQIGQDPQQLWESFTHVLARAIELGSEQGELASLSIVGGRNKFGDPEDITITLEPGSVTSIVGPTGSGKSRLLADIEWLAQGDTPTGRQILINGQVPDPELRFSLENKLVAQLSQNMNFVVDAKVGEFIEMHAASRQITTTGVLDQILSQANLLAGEAFSADTPLTALSGGQSRALMIADTAFLSASPVVLIDEIENAGIDRQQALSLLVDRNKIVLISTHDPVLALMAGTRLVIRHGGVAKKLTTSLAEQQRLSELESADRQLQQLRQQLREGSRLA
ncbi:ATP-binding cassette domain-containing protein [Vibrio sp. WXL103]|uniref:ATP-binding cassette domain-containing protein n=1 Tax=Vibrio sp. WXL103 TaxID=3450710 RepID=UPI003EC51838